jgi:O-antigen ligase
VALTVRRGPYRGFLYVTVDGEPANALPRDGEGRAYVVLYDAEPNVATVPLATGLGPGVHTVEVVAEGGHGQWPLVDWRVDAGPVRGCKSANGFVWKLGGLGAAGLALLALLVRDARQVDWRSIRRAFLAWPERAQMTLIVSLTGLFWAAVALLPTPYSLLPISLLPVLALLFSWRLDLGLALIAFAAPFYLVPEQMVYRALSLPEILVILCAVAYGISRVIRRSTNLPVSQSTNFPISQLTNLLASPLDRAVALLVAAAVIASIGVSDRGAALFDLRSIFLLPALTYALLRGTRLDEESRWRLVDGFVLGGVGVALVGLAQMALGRNVVLAEGGLPRLQSVYHSPNNVALYLGRAWPFLVAVALWGTKGRRRVLYALALAPVTLALALSFSRGALLLALPAALLTMGWRVGGRWRWAAVALVLIGALALIPLLRAPRVPRFASLLDLGEGSTFFRLSLWRSSLRMVREHPIFGVGPGNFLAAYRTRYVLPSAWQEFNLEHPHNVYLDHWTRLGLLGVLAGMLIQFVFWRRIRRHGRRDPLTLGLVGSMAALLAHGLVDNALFFPDLALSFFLLLALAKRR